MRRTDRWVWIALVILGALCLTPRAAGAQPPAGGVECSWTCHCARQAEDCDKREARWDVCLDTAPTRHPDKVASCDRCKALAEEECRKRTCPPDPQKGPKHAFEVFCDGKSQSLSAVPPQLGSPMVASPSVGRRAHEKPEPRHGGPAVPTAAPQGRAKCTFDCACSVATGKCDDREQRSELCLDKAQSTETGENCVVCSARAWLACNARKCPLLGGTTKVMVNFVCPAP